MTTTLSEHLPADFLTEHILPEHGRAEAQAVSSSTVPASRPQPTPVVGEMPARLEQLFDAGTAVLRGSGGGVFWGTGSVSGMPSVGFATDPRVQGGALGLEGCQLIVAAYRHALAFALPIAGVWFSGGARLQEGAKSLHGVGLVFGAMTRASGVIPQVSLVVGAAAGGAAYGPALTDVVVVTPGARVFVTGPDVVRSVTGEDIDAEGLGGSHMHGTRSGVAHVVADSDDDGYARVRSILLLLSGRRNAVPAGDRADLASLVPAGTRQAYDIHPVVDAVLDEPGQELQAGWARNVATVLGRLDGRPIGVVATNPAWLAGCLDAAASDKAARFVRLCDSLGLPILVLVDVPGYLPGVQQEADGIVRRGAKLVHAFAAARVPCVTVLMRKAYGGAYIALNSRSLGATAVFAWPTAELDVMNATAAVRILHRKRLAMLPPASRAKAEERLSEDHLAITGGIDTAIADGLVDAVIRPDETRARVAQAFAAAGSSRGHHGNIPL